MKASQWIIASILAILIIVLLVLFGTQTIRVVALSLLAAAALTAFVVRQWAKGAGPSERYASAAQGFAAIVTVAALFVAAGVYFLERKDKFRLSVGLDANVIRINSRPGRQGTVLLTVRVPIENRGAVRVDIKCISIDVLRPASENLEARNPMAGEETRLQSLGMRIAYENDENRECIREEEGRLPPPGGTIRPLFMWLSLPLEPGDERDRYFEIPVRCDAPFVRVLVKVRVNATDSENHEVKTIVPLIDTCAGREQSSSGVSMPSSEGGGSASQANDREQSKVGATGDAS